MTRPHGARNSGRAPADEARDCTSRKGERRYMTAEARMAPETRMTPEIAWAEAMKFENRANPYPFFDELRKTPVARVMHGIYAVTGYRELVTLAHDPRVSSDIKHSFLAPQLA